MKTYLALVFLSIFSGLTLGALSDAEDWLNPSQRLRWAVFTNILSSQRIGRTLDIQHRYADAAPYFEDVLVDQLKYYGRKRALDCVDELAQCYYKAGRFSDADKLFQRFPEAALRFQVAFQHYVSLFGNREGFNYYVQGLLRDNWHTHHLDYEGAIESFSKAIELSQSFVAYSDRGYSYARLGKNMEAIADFSRAIDLTDSDIIRCDLYQARAICYFSSKEYESSIVDSTRAIAGFSAAEFYDSHKTGLATAYKFRAWARINLKDYGRALEDLSKAILIEPTQLPL